VTAAGAYLCAMQQVGARDPTFFTSLGDWALPDAFHRLSPGQKTALKAQGPIVFLMNGAGDVLVLCYGYGALAASCKVDNSGESAHAEALCKLGIAIAPFAYGDDFPVVRYAMVHGSNAASTSPGKLPQNIVESLETALESARAIHDGNHMDSVRASTTRTWSPTSRAKNSAGSEVAAVRRQRRSRGAIGERLRSRSR